MTKNIRELTMPFFTIIRKPIKSGVIPIHTQHPSHEQLVKDLESYSQIYIFHSLADAKKVAPLFFLQPREPKVGGWYGLIAEVEIVDTKPEMLLCDASLVYNNWAQNHAKKHRTLYLEAENAGIDCHCSIIQPINIKSITRTFIPDEAKASNPNLHDTDFNTVEMTQARTTWLPKCSIL